MNDQTIETTTVERQRYDDLRASAVDGEHVDEDTLIDALAAAKASEERAALRAEIDAERAAHRDDEAGEIDRLRAAGESKLSQLATALFEAKDIRVEAHSAMKAAIAEYDRAARAQVDAVARLSAALREHGYPDARPRRGSESAHVHPDRHHDAGSGTVHFDNVTGTRRVEYARDAIPRFLAGITATAMSAR